MREITINHNKPKGKTTYQVYEQEEADELDIGYVPWKDVKTGEYGVTDDGIVAKCIKKSTYKNNNGGTSVYVRFPWGYTLYQLKYAENRKLKARDRKNAYTFTGESQWHIGKKKRTMENIALCYAQVFNKDFAIALATGGVSQTKHRSYRRYMRTEKFRQMVRSELRKLLKKQDLTEEYTLNLLKEGIEMAKKNEDVTNILKACKNLQSLHGMDQKDKIKSTAALEVNETRRIIDNLKQEKRQLKASVTKDAEDAELVEDDE